MIHRIIPEKVDIAVGGGGAAACGASCAGTGVIVGEGATALAKRAIQQKCDTSAVTIPVFGLYLVGTSCHVPYVVSKLFTMNSCPHRACGTV
jgi:hypothetical protein